MAQPKKPRRAELKGLMNQVFSERWTPFSGLAGPPKRGDADLLIQQGLLSRWRWRGGNSLLNLKDLLTVLQSSRKRVFENGPVLRPLFWCRTVPNSAIFLPKRGKTWHKIDVFRDRFCENVPGPAAGSHPNEPRTHKLAGRPGSITGALQHGFVVKQPEDFTSGPASWLVTDMVKLRKLIGGDLRHFHHPYHGLGGKAVLQTNGLSEQVSVFGRFWGYQILPNFTNFYQKCVAKGVRRGSKRQLTRGFSRPIY